jgi:small subunit ribosomal protein S1
MEFFFMLNHSDKNLESSETVSNSEQVGVTPPAPETVSTPPTLKVETAGPKEEPKYVFVKMDKYFLEDNYDAASFVDLSEKYKEITDQFKAGMLIRGRIIEREPRGILVSINYKSDGFVPSFEFSDHEFSKLAVGDFVEVMIDALEDAEGNLILSYQKAKSIRVWNEITKIFETNGSTVGRITHKVKGGLNIDIGIPAFLPGSQIDVSKVMDFDQYVGQEVACKIIKINKKRGNVIVSRRACIEEERNESRKKSLENLQEGQVIRGLVKNITSYGAFVDIGGIDGLLHITDMSWGRISHPSELLKIGDEISVKILSFDKDNAKISLGIKQLFDNPWQGIDKRFPEGCKVKGRISSITDYGLFVEVAPGVEGLVHISEISWTERVQDLHSRYKINEEIEVVVASVEKNERRMSLSVKRLDNDPWKVAFDKFKPGDRISGTVSNVTDFGVFVKIYPGVDGLVHVSDISWIDHIDTPREKFKKNDAVEVVVLAIEEEKHRISLGIKQLQKDPWENIEAEFPVGNLVDGVVSKVTNFGVFVKFPNGIEGLAYISELSNKEIPDIAKFIAVGTKENFKVIKSSASERKLGLSLKAVKEPVETEEAEARIAARRSTVAGKTDSYKVAETHKAPVRHQEGSERAVDRKKVASAEPNVKGALQIALEKMKQDSKTVASSSTEEATAEPKE